MHSDLADYSDGAIRMVECYVAKWLRESKLGLDILEELHDLPFEQVMDHVYEMLNLGVLKITANRSGFTGIEIRFPPQPPRVPICRARAC
jgi:hypothetical protein